MRTITWVAIVLLTGCANLTDGQRLALQIGASVLVVGAVAAYSNNGNHQGPNVFTPTDPCVPDPNACR